MSAIPKDIYVYMCNYCSHTFKDLLLVNPVIEKEVGTPPSLLPTIVCPRKGGIEGNQMKSTEYMYFNT